MYKAEFFAQDFTFAAAYLLDEADTVLTLDYLTMDKCSLDLPVRKTPVKKGDFCRVSRVGGTVLADFTVADCSCEESDCTVSLRPLQAVLDVDVYNDGIPDCAAWLAQQIRTYLIANSDAAQNRALVLENTVPAADRPLTLDGDTANLLDVLATALTAYRLVLDAQLDLANKCIRLTLGQATTSAVLEADLPNVLEREITLGDSYGSKNKYILRRTSTDQETGTVTVLEEKSYYLHPDGSVDDQNVDRITPVFWTLGKLENSETWDADALAQAVEALTPEQYDNEIRLTLRRDDKLVTPETLPIGTEATIYIGGQAYRSLLTGREWDGDTHCLVFGKVRVDLTKKLILQRRNTL